MDNGIIPLLWTICIKFVLVQSVELYPYAHLVQHTPALYGVDILFPNDVTIFSTKINNARAMQKGGVWFYRNTFQYIAVYGTKAPPDTSKLWYTITSDAGVLARIKQDLANTNVSIFENFEPSNAVIITWYSSSATPVTLESIFQLVFSYDQNGEESFVILNYGKLEWGDSATAKFKTASKTYHLPGSGTDDVADELTKGSNCGVLGKWVFRTTESVQAPGDFVEETTEATEVTTKFITEEKKTASTSPRKTTTEDNKEDTEPNTLPIVLVSVFGAICLLLAAILCIMRKKLRTNKCCGGDEVTTATTNTTTTTSSLGSREFHQRNLDVQGDTDQLSDGSKPEPQAVTVDQAAHSSLASTNKTKSSSKSTKGAGSKWNCFS